MPKALLCNLYDQKSNNCNFKYKHTYHYVLSDGIKVKLKKETASFTKYAGWGLQAVTSIPKNYILGYFVNKIRNAEEPEKGTYNIKKHNGLYLVAHPESLMNKINTIASKKHRHLCNCKIQNLKNGKVSIKTIKNIKAGSMLWTKYGDSRHYWDIQWSIVRARLFNPNTTDDDNDFKCRWCWKQHEELIMCDSCPSSTCRNCLTNKEKYLLNLEYFFCNRCLSKSSPYPNRWLNKNKKSINI